jgi:hypothetical protein
MSCPKEPISIRILIQSRNRPDCAPLVRAHEPICTMRARVKIAKVAAASNEIAQKDFCKFPVARFV